jgi:hypothetical protein
MQVRVWECGAQGVGVWRAFMLQPLRSRPSRWIQRARLTSVQAHDQALISAAPKTTRARHLVRSQHRPKEHPHNTSMSSGKPTGLHHSCTLPQPQPLPSPPISSLEPHTSPHAQSFPCAWRWRRRPVRTAAGARRPRWPRRTPRCWGPQAGTPGPGTGH